MATHLRSLLPLFWTNDLDTSFITLVTIDAVNALSDVLEWLIDPLSPYLRCHASSNFTILEHKAQVLLLTP